MAKVKKGKNNEKKDKRLFYTICVFVLIWATIKISVDTVNKFAIDSFKRLYGAYSKALSLTVLDMDGDTGCYFSAEKGMPNDFSGCDKFYKKFVSNMSVTKYCDKNGKRQGCIPTYKRFATDANCAGYSEKMMNLFNQSYVLNDQTNIIVFNMPSDSPKPLFAVDSNGKMFPNKTGYDLFSLVIMKNSKGDYYFHPNVVYCLPPEKGGIQKLQDIYSK